MRHPRLFSAKRPGVIRMEASGKTATILIYDEIGEGWYGGLGSKEFVQQLIALGDLDTINVRINSPGGDVFEGVAIYNALKMHNAKVHVQIDSLAASIATVIAMAGDTIAIAPAAMMMVHNPAALTFGEAEDLRATADLLDKLRDTTMMTAYARTGIAEEELRGIMAAETWYSGQEAVDAGWADSLAIAPSGEAEASLRFDLSAFKHPPAAKQLQVEQKPEPEAEEYAANLQLRQRKERARQRAL